MVLADDSEPEKSREDLEAEDAEEAMFWSDEEQAPAGACPLTALHIPNCSVLPLARSAFSAYSCSLPRRQSTARELGGSVRWRARGTAWQQADTADQLFRVSLQTLLSRNLSWRVVLALFSEPPAL